MIDNVVKVASYIYSRYKEETGDKVDEMKLHKLLYFAQRESIIQTGEPMFDAPFEAWKYGPVQVTVRERYRTGALDSKIEENEMEEYREVFDTVFANYAKRSSVNLSILSHNESSWRNARKGLMPDDKCSKELSLTDIRKDAERIKIRRFVFSLSDSQSYGN